MRVMAVCVGDPCKISLLVFAFLPSVKGYHQLPNEHSHEKKLSLYKPTYPHGSHCGVGAMCVQLVDFDITCKSGQFRILQRSCSTHEPSDPLPRVV